MNTKPNVLILFTDEQRHDTIGAAGFPYMITPNLDRLAAEGVIYSQAHSTNPVCMPARHDMITGLPSKAHGYYENNEGQTIKDYSLPTLPRIFSQNGYRTAAIGKMHFKPVREHHGFGEMLLMEEMPRNRQDDQYAMDLNKEGLGEVQNIHGIRPLLYLVPQVSSQDEVHHGNTWVADKTIEWLGKNGEQPFFLMSSWISPHPPFSLPKEYFGLYSDRDIPEPVPVSRLKNAYEEDGAWYGDGEPKKVLRKLREAYYSAITMVDKNIGRILDYLQKSGQIDNTLIIFTSDHGELLGDKGYYLKSQPYEGSVRIPFIVRYPEKFKPGLIKEDFVDLMDILPTCLDVCGLSYPGSQYDLVGESLCQEHPVKNRSYQYASTGQGISRWVMCRNDSFKYVYRYYHDMEELYDLKKDPGETNNLMEEDNCPAEVLQELRRNVLEYELKWGPEKNVSKDGMIRQEIPEGKKLTVGMKYGLGIAGQFQRFTAADPKARGEQFLKEAEKALQDPEVTGGLTMGNICNHEDYVKGFMEHWRRFAGDEVPADRLFNNADK